MTGVISYLSWQMFQHIAQLEGLTAEILGMDVSLEQADLDALKAFARILDSAKHQ